MAEAKKSTRIVPSTTLKEVSTITLTLTLEEARTLARLAQRIGGDPRTTRRGHIAAIDEALDSAGINGAETEEDPSFKLVHAGGGGLPLVRRSI